MRSTVVLLRAVNVGGRNAIPMGELRGLLEGLGYGGVRTHLQSGNVVLSAPATGDAELGAAIERGIAQRFGLEVAVVLRSAEEFARIAEHHPLQREGEDPARLHVMFFQRPPAAERVAALDPDRSPPDRFVVRGREIYAHYPGGAGRSKLTVDYFERVLGVPGTARNWRTVTRLRALTGAR